ncbi:MAG: aminotransferase class V-fold PLP-dependent enzyme [Anaerolineales bacterium]|nr:aminotransferase class V-fold PLP-dependent enzyme [Anaerolineales bacterium]
MNNLKSQFLLDPEIIFLNHGSFGATPKPVFEAYQGWQRKLESQPVKFLGREIQDHFRYARQQLAVYLGADPSNLVFIQNATFGVNIVARSLNFQEEDEVLTSNHEYGACENVWSFMNKKTGVKIVQQKIPLPLGSPDEIVDIFWQGVTDHTRLIFLSQITSPTAVRLPVEKICQKARDSGLLTLIDGAHAPGQLDLNLEKIGADFYTGNCHKWLLAPKGSAFLHVLPERQDLIDPLVVSWGWGENCPYENDSQFLASLEWTGTIDPAAYLSVPAAIEFQEKNHWKDVREDCQELLDKTLAQIEERTGMPSIYGSNPGNSIQLGAAELPPGCQADKLQSWLYDKHKIEIPVIDWENRWFIRPSVQGYNTREELVQLVEAVGEYLK